MLIKCICTNCAGHLEFEEDSAGETIECPHCHFETVLYLPEGTGAALLTVPRKRLSKLQRRLIFIGGPVLLFFLAGFAFYRWILAPFVDWLPYSDAPKLPMFFLTVVSLVILLVWSCVPILLLLEMRNMTRALRRIESNLRPVLRVEPAHSEEEQELGELEEPVQEEGAEEPSKEEAPVEPNQPS